MTTVVLSLSAGSTMMSVFRFWRINRSCLVMFGGGLALERILICLRILSACSNDL